HGDSGVSSTDVKLSRTSSFKKPPRSPRIIRNVTDTPIDSTDFHLDTDVSDGNGFRTPPLSPLLRRNSLLSPPELDRLPRSKSLNSASRGGGRRKSPLEQDGEDEGGFKTDAALRNLLESQAIKKVIEEKEALEQELDKWRKVTPPQIRIVVWNIEYLYKLEDTHSTTIQDLKSQNAELKKRLALKDKECGDAALQAKVAEESLAVLTKEKQAWGVKEQGYLKTIAGVKADQQVLEETNSQSETMNREKALIAMIRTLEEQTQLAKKAMESLEMQVEMMSRERKDRVVTDPDTMMDQIERQELEIEALKEQLNNERVQWTKISSKANQIRDADTVGKPFIPPRISSAVELVHQIPDGAGSLEVEMLKSRVVDSLMNEIKELRSQNLLIITNFVATLDNVTNMGTL
ncbi:hypothetical protein BC829DRAFT_405728, partial [Chytridium lagenaria]